MIKLKTPEEIEKLKIGGKKLADILHATAEKVAPGVSTAELNDFAHDLMIKAGGKPSFLNYTPVGAMRSYPASLCVSINDEIVHGVPNENPTIIEEGDVVTVDGGLIYEGMYTDSAITVIAGSQDNIPKEVNNLLNRTKEALNAGIKQCVVGNRIGDVSAAIQKVADEAGLSVMENLTGHGVGYGVHEDPYVPNAGKAGTGDVIEEGLVIAIEPMFSLGGSQITETGDGYTYATKDGSLSAQYEHTIAVTKDGPIICTLI